MAMKFLVFSFILTSALPAAAAWGVNERSVAKWSDEKLCESLRTYDSKEDWKAVAAVAKEIARRQTLAIDQCSTAETQSFADKKNKAVVMKKNRVLSE